MNDAAPQAPENVVELDLDETAGEAGAEAAPARDDRVDVDESTTGADDDVRLPKGAVLLDGAQTIGGAAVSWTLRFPVKLTVKNTSGVIATETISKLTMHRLTAADMEATMNSGRDAQKTLILRSSRLPMTRAARVFEKLDGYDIMALSEIVAFLLEGGRKTGR